MPPSSPRALFVGRFQPFHLGHLHALKIVLDRASEVVIVVGSAQYSHTHQNPFTAGERVTMIRLALDEAKIDPSKYFIVPIPDMHIHKMWVPHVVSQTPKFDVIFTNEPLTSRLFREENYNVLPIPFLDRETYSATEIRKRLLQGGDWESLVPKSVVDYIKSIDGVERIRDLAKTDRPVSRRC